MQNTTIYSNGSKWLGEEPDTIDKLISVLKNNTIEERFFEPYQGYKNKTDRIKNSLNRSPIDNSEEIQKIHGKNMFLFFGNFEEISHVFRIATCEPELINKLKKAIKENKGYKKYFKKTRV
ncbi:MAG: hypothetical protein ACJA1B_001421 [Polaribacter sp.]|jgi:hypothetical protein